MQKGRQEPRSPSRLFLVVLALLAGGIGGLLANWRVLGSTLGLFPQLDVPYIREVRREAFIEESANITAVERASKSILSLFVSAGSDSAGGTSRDGRAPGSTAIMLTDDGLLYLLPLGPVAFGDLTVQTRDGFRLPLTQIGVDPWGGGIVARAELRGVPALELEAVRFSDATPRLGQHLVGLRGGWTVSVVPGTFSGNDAGEMPFFQQSEALLEGWSIEPAAAPVPYFDLQGALVGIQSIGSAVSAASLDALLAQVQATGRVERPVFGMRARTTPLAQPGIFGGAEASAEIVSVAPGGPAAAAGLQAGDSILSVNGRALSTEYHLLDALVRQRAGGRIDLSVRRAGARSEHVIVAGSTAQGT